METRFPRLRKNWCHGFRAPDAFICIFQPPYDLSELYHLFCVAIPGKRSSHGCLVYSSIHDSIKANYIRFTSNQAPDACQVSLLKTACSNSSAPKLLQTINKNAIIAEYTESCHQKGNLSELTTIRKGEPTESPITYPSIYELVQDCLMKPNLNHQYVVSDAILDNVIIKLLKHSKSFLMDKEITRLSKVNSLYREMIHDVVRLRNLDFSQMREPRTGYTEQTAIQQSRMDMATACAIHYSLHPGMIIRHAKGEYVGENRDVTQILRNISPHIDETNAVHIK
jgi:hypothetical protein